MADKKPRMPRKKPVAAPTAPLNDVALQEAVEQAAGMMNEAGVVALTALQLGAKWHVAYTAHNLVDMQAVCRVVLMSMHPTTLGAVVACMLTEQNTTSGAKFAAEMLIVERGVRAERGC